MKITAETLTVYQGETPLYYMENVEMEFDMLEAETAFRKKCANAALLAEVDAEIRSSKKVEKSEKKMIVKTKKKTDKAPAKEKTQIQKEKQVLYVRRNQLKKQGKLTAEANDEIEKSMREIEQRHEKPYETQH